MRLILTILFFSFLTANGQVNNNARGWKATHGPVSGAATYENEEQTYDAVCPSGYTGGPFTAVVPAGTYTASTLSAANDLAMARAIEIADSTAAVDCSPAIGTDLSTYPLMVSTNPGLANPGDAFIFNAAATPAANTPTVAMYNNQASTNEHIAATYSAGSTVTSISVYNGTSVQDGTVSTAGSDAGIFRMPAIGNKFSVAWLTNSSGRGKAIKINAPDVRWILEKVSVGQAAQIFGRNLSYNGGTSISYVYYRNTSTGAFTSCTVTSVNPYRVGYTVPSVSNGTYEVWVHKGEGGDYGWSKSPTNVTVVSTSNNVLLKTNWGSISTIPAAVVSSTTNRTNINTAIGTGGKIVTFGLGVYTVSGTINARSNTKYVGGLSGTAPGTTIRLTSAISNPNEGLLNRDTSSISMLAFENIIFEANGLSTGADAFIQFVGCSDIWFKNCKIDARLFEALDLRDGANIHLENTSIIGGSWQFGQVVYLANLTQFFVDGGTFEMTKDCSGIFINVGIKEYAVRNITVRDLNIAATDGTGTGKGRIWSCLLNGGSTWDGHIENATGVNLGVRRTGTSLPDANSGEILLHEAAKTFIRLTATGGTSTTITFSSAPTAYAGNSHITIVSGKGKGQTRRVVSTGTTITVHKAWEVTPDNTSVVEIGYGVDNVVYYNNTIDGKVERVNDATNNATAHCAVENYGNCFDIVATNNAINEVRVGFTVYSTQHTTTTNDPNFFNVFKYNTVNNARYGIDLNATATPTAGSHPNVAILGTVVEGNTFTNTVTQTISGTAYTPHFTYDVLFPKTYTFAILDLTVLGNNTASNSQFYNWWGTDNGQGCSGSYPCPPKTTEPTNSVSRTVNYGNNSGL